MIAESCICAPIGGYMNHVRWLALADERMHFNISRAVYPKDRNAFNWLRYEWTHRLKDVICDKIQCFHYPSYALGNLPQLKKLVFLYQSPAACLHHYLKFNPLLNKRTVDGFIIETENVYNSMRSFNQDGIEVLDLNVDDLNNQVLDPAWYYNLINFLNLPPDYESAAKIHHLWYEANKRAEDQMQYLPRLVEDFPWEFDKDQVLTKQAVYDRLLQLIESIYK